MASLFILSFLQLTCLMMIFLFIGKLTAPLVLTDPSPKRYWRLTIELLIGLLLSVTLYAVMKSGGRTVMSLYGFALLIYCLLNIRELRFNRKPLYKNTLEFLSGDSLLILLSALMFYTISFLFLYNPISSRPTLFYTDFYLYADLSDVMRLTGREDLFGSRGEFLAMKDKLSYPALDKYHYFELWITALCTSIFGNSSLLNFTLITGSAMKVIFFISLAALWENFKKIGLREFALLLIIIGIAAPFLPFYKDFWLTRYFHQYTTNNIYYPWVHKHMAYFISAILFFNLYHQGKTKNAFLVWTIPLIANIGTVPALMGGLLFYIMTCRMAVRQKFILVASLSAIFTSIILFYSSASAESSFFTQTVIYQVMSDPGYMLGYKIIVVDFLVTLLKLLLFTFPVAFIIFLNRDKLGKVQMQAFWLTTIICSAGSFLGAITVGFREHMQFFSYVAPVYIVWLMTSAIILFPQINKKTKAALISIMLVYSAYNALSYILYDYHKVHWIKVGSISKSDFNKARKIMSGKGPYVNIIWLSERENIIKARQFYPLPTMQLNNIYENIIYASPYQLLDSEDEEEKLFMEKSPFYLFYKDNPEQPFYTTLENFVKLNRIEYLIVDRTLTDEFSGRYDHLDTIYTDVFNRKVLLSIDPENFVKNESIEY